MNTLQIGRCGELLVQYKLLKLGIDSSALTTDSGIDLVAYSPIRNNAFTIQVKTNEKAKQGGGAGSLALDWWLRENSPAQLIALVDLESDEIWLFTHQEFSKLAQQNSNGRFHFYMYLSDDVKTKKRALKSQFTEFLLKNKVGELLL